MNKIKFTTPSDAVSRIKSEDNIFIGGGAVVPKTLIQALTNRSSSLKNVGIHHILTLGNTNETAPYTLPGMKNSFRH